MPLDFQVVYVNDPDGHVLELISLPIDELVDVINATVGGGGSPPGLAT